MAWRQARGELGNQPAASSSIATASLSPSQIQTLTALASAAVATKQNNNSSNNVKQDNNKNNDDAKLRSNLDSPEKSDAADSKQTVFNKRNLRLCFFYFLFF